jgi:hypothetical protein
MGDTVREVCQLMMPQERKYVYMTVLRFGTNKLLLQYAWENIRRISHASSL